MADNFSTQAPGLTSPASDAFAITPSDGVDLAQVCRAIYVGTGGNVTLITAAGSTALFKNLPAGSILPQRTSRVKATGTTATDLVAMV